jgi:uncharacterized membrane protein YhaH (DUF805 family)
MHWMLMPLKRYAEFSGRSRRMEFWMWQLFKFLISCVIWVIFIALFGSAMFSGDPTQLMAAMGSMMLLWGLCMIFGLAIIIPDIAVSVRRLHDTNRTGWWLLAPLVPYVIAIVAMGGTIGMGAAMGGKESGAAAMGIGGIIFMICMIAVLALGVTLIVFYFLEGTPGPNRFGPDPKGRESGEVFS